MNIPKRDICRARMLVRIIGEGNGDGEREKDTERLVSG